MRYDDHEQMNAHLFTDASEALAFALVGVRETDHASAYTVREVIPIAHDTPGLHRAPNQLRWPLATILPPLFDRASAEGLMLLKIHSHPMGWLRFSETDDASDRELGRAMASLGGEGAKIISAVMIPGGEMIARLISDGGATFTYLDGVLRGGSGRYFKDVHKPKGARNDTRHFSSERDSEALGGHARKTFSTLRVGVVGCSGTGSHVIHQLARLGVGELVLVDPDDLDEANLSRVLFGYRKDIGKPKVELAAAAVNAIDPDIGTLGIAARLYDADAVDALASCDVLFGCVDALEPREVLSRLAERDLIPYFDVGVGCVAGEGGGIVQAQAGVHVIDPGDRGLMARGLYSAARLGDEMKARYLPEHHDQLQQDGYIEGARDPGPAIISLNGVGASMAVCEFVQRFCFDRQERTDHLLHSWSHNLLYARSTGVGRGASAGVAARDPNLGMVF